MPGFDAAQSAYDNASPYELPANPPHGECECDGEDGFCSVACEDEYHDGQQGFTKGIRPEWRLMDQRDEHDPTL